MRRAFVVIFVVGFLSFGLFASSTGFYHDDWTLLELASPQNGYWSNVAAFGQQFAWSRPIEFLQFPAFILLGGRHPVVYQALLLLLDVLQGGLLFIFLNGLLDWRDLALLASCLALIYPNHAVTHHWFACSPQSLALVLSLSGLVLGQRGVQTRRPALTALGAFFHLMAGLCYESILFLPLMLGGGRFSGMVFDGIPKKRAAIDAARELLPFGAAVLAVVLWQRVGAPAYMGAAPLKGAAFSLRHAAEVFKAGFGCITYQTVRLCLRTAIPAWNAVPASLLLLWGAFVASVTTALSLPKIDVVRSSSRSLAIALGAVFAGYVAANLPYALSRDYWPTYVGIMGRTSALGALPGGLALAAAAAALVRSPRRGAVTAQGILLATVIGAFTWCNWHTSWQWARSWKIQQDILKRISPKARALPDSAKVLLAGAPRYINTACDEVIIFDATWDFSSALRLTTGRHDLGAEVVTPRMDFAREGLVVRSPEGVVATVPYRGYFLYRYDRDLLIALTGPPSAPVPVRDF